MPCFEWNNFGGHLCLKNEFVSLPGVWSDNLTVMSHVLALLSHTIGTVDIRVTFVTGLSSRRTIFFRKSYKINKFRGKHLHLITSIFNFVCLLILSSPPLELPCILLLREFVFIKSGLFQIYIKINVRSTYVFEESLLCMFDLEHARYE